MKEVAHLHYSEWDRRGIGDFKRQHAFEQVDLPRYYAPLNARRRLLLKPKLHRGLSARLPDKLLDGLIELRNRCNAVRFGRSRA